MAKIKKEKPKETVVKSVDQFPPGFSNAKPGSPQATPQKRTEPLPSQIVKKK